jgi:hypothetical protein
MVAAAAIQPVFFLRYLPVNAQTNAAINGTMTACSKIEGIDVSI